MTRILVAGVDPGNSALKVVARTGEKTIESIVAPGVERTLRRSAFGELAGTTAANDTDALDVEVRLDDQPRYQHYFFGALARNEGREPTYMFDRQRAGTDANRAAIFVGLALLAESDDQEFVINAGLPVQDFINAQVRDRFRKSLIGTAFIRFKDGPWAGQERRVRVVEARVMPQGQGIIIDAGLDDKLSTRDPELFNDRIALVDVGFRTTNLLLINGGRPVDAYSQGTEHGIHHVYDDLVRHLAQYGVNVTPEILGPHFNDAMFRRVPLTAAREEALKKLASQIRFAAEKLWSSQMSSVGRILIAGGGGRLLFDYLALPNKELVPNYRMANARGFWKAAELVRAASVA